jgi:chloramphenicol-sensitive protein RarD
MSSPTSTSPHAPLDSRGLLAAMSAFTIWGMFPIYLKWLAAVPVAQVTAHRLVWGCVFAFIWLALRGEVKNVFVALKTPGVRWRLLLTASLISCNWLIFTYAIVSNQVVETSLGYFINPLLNVVIGVVILSERLNPAQWTAVGIASIGVAYLTWTVGHPPWIALGLALTFGFYGLARKVVKADALVGFASETLLLVALGVAYLIWVEVQGTASLFHGPGTTSLLLILSGPLSAIPLVLFAYGARRIPYSTVGLLQYIGPTIQLLLATLVYHEPFNRERWIGFSIIWIALAIFAGDGLWRSRKIRI